MPATTLRIACTASSWNPITFIAPCIVHKSINKHTHTQKKKLKKNWAGQYEDSLEIGLVVERVDLINTALVRVVVVGRTAGEAELGLEGFVGATEQLVIDVEVALLGGLVHDTGLQKRKRKKEMLEGHVSSLKTQKTAPSRAGSW